MVEGGGCPAAKFRSTGSNNVSVTELRGSWQNTVAYLLGEGATVKLGR
jgi:hypothetical protein